MKTFADYGIDLRGRTGEVKTTCPKCSPTRKKKNYPCLSVNTEKGLWNCWHCSWSGSLHKGEEHQSVSPTKPTYRKPVWHEPLALDKRARDFLHRRGITNEVIERAKIGFTRVYMPQVEDEVEAIEFPFFRDGEVVNVKYRQIDQKNFRMYGGAERILYGLDDINDEEVVIVEGEMDKLACAVAGYWSCVSVPDGAPAPNTKDYASKFSFLDTDRLANVKRFVLATDADAPGEALREELARRLGRERCWLVDFDGAKDANEYLLKNGADALSRALREAKPYPIQGLVEIDDVADKVKALYEHGWPRGLCTGWKCLDQFYTVRPGELTIVTGIPNSGKSNWLDALLVNMAKIHNWRFALFSPENQPIEDHAGRIAEKFINAPFREGARRRMGEDELHVALNWIGDHFSWILPSDDSDWSLDNVLSIAKSLVQRKGIQGLVIDPWNELEQYRAPGMSETEYVSACLKRIRQFARAHGIHVWVVAHPAKLYRDNGKYPVPTLYDISGSAHWRNKADNGICVWRELSEINNGNEVQIYVQKVRFRQVGRVGCATLVYEAWTGNYIERL